MNFWAIAQFLKHTMRGAGFSHERQMKSIERYPNESFLEVIKRNNDVNLSADYMNGMYFGLSLAAASEEKEFEGLVSRIIEDEEKKELDDWEVKPLGELK